MPSAWTRFKDMVRLEETEAMRQSDAEGKKLWINKDLAPNPPETRHWVGMSYFLFQFSISFSPTTYNAGASLISIGLLWWHVFLAAIVGSVLCSALAVLNARGAARYHIGFPSFVRISAGLNGSLLWVFIRGVVAIFYCGTQLFYAGKLMDVCLRCIGGSSYVNMPNHLPESAGITSRGLLSFMLVWLIQAPFMFLEPHQTKRVFAYKSYFIVPSLCATMAWAVAKSGGSAHLDQLVVTSVGASQLGWGFMKALNTCISNVLPPLVNIADLARYSNKPSDTHTVAWGLLVSKPLVILVGIVIASCGKHLYGTAYWNLWDFFNAVLTNNWGSTARALVFFASLSQVFATFMTNISSNTLPVGCDLAGLFPRFFSIRRGQVLCACLAVLVVPWKLVSTASAFITFLGSYTGFICPILAIQIVDYWVVRRGNVHMQSVFTGDKSSVYWYYKGVNIRAYVAWISGLVLVVHGVANALKKGSLGAASTHIYDNGFILSTTCGGLVYYLLCRVWPPAIYPAEHADESTAFEHMASTEGFFEGDELMPDYLAGRGLFPGARTESESDTADEKKDLEATSISVQLV